ncbi:low-density lipoprotein receptor-related protein 12-like [Saccostrea echinata]|uniref:low-density lipoprotein receptor-related protein 12-like n=1 Tax=Saccostrea echinata TaxID=191078 RepID=UPI002A800604|nr:low-density lipoprotein receptor-related protein 12-like [Saccostrea echinata]
MELSKLFGFCVLSFSILTSSQAEECFHDEYKEETERITSQNFPVGYPPNWCAQWYITARKGEIITLSIYLDIEVGDDSTCNRDSLTIGPDPLQQYCGKNRKLVYISNMSHVWLKFNSDSIMSGKGFQINYIRGLPQAKFCKQDQFHCKNGKCILDNWVCNGLDECGDRSDEYDELCHSATAMPTAPPSIDCGEEFFPCYSNLSEGLICLPKAKKCDGAPDCYGGLDEKNCSINCNKHIHSEVGYITSPLYPRDYPPHMDCKWTIHMQNPTDRIQLRLLDFAVQPNDNTDYVTVYDGKDEANDQVLGTFYGDVVPPSKLESTSNWMTIVFHSDNSFSEKGFNFSYQKKGFCLKNQIRCSNGEDDCFDANEKCNGIWDCKEKGGDELHCGNCNVLYSCGSGSSQCYPKSHRCNGVGFCTNKMDEKNCSPQQCGSHNGTFLCQNKNCIYEAWICDKTDDCGDQSDEINCGKTTNLIIIAAVSGSLICGLLLVVALGCTCKLYNLRQQQLHGPRHETPLSRVYAEFMRRRAPPPYHEAMLTS